MAPARDRFQPVVFLVDPATAVANLSSKQIVDIFTGKVVAWTEIGDKGGKIAVANRPAAKRFFKFIKSAEGQQIIKDYGAIPADVL